MGSPFTITIYGKDSAAIESSRNALAVDARKAGFGWVGQRVATRSLP